VADTFYVGQITEQSVIARMGVSSLLGPAGFAGRGLFHLRSCRCGSWPAAIRGTEVMEYRQEIGLSPP
jgi:hypothetical protein